MVAFYSSCGWIASVIDWIAGSIDGNNINIGNTHTTYESTDVIGNPHIIYIWWFGLFWLPQFSRLLTTC